MTASSNTSALIVLGMHRSGTSALAGVLSMAGTDPGPSLMPAVSTVNPKGFWEHQDIVAIHERLLSALNSSWDDDRPLPDNWWHQPNIAVFRHELMAVLRRDFSTSPLWILKDPRLCRLLPLWLDMLEKLGVKPHFIICVRHPREVALSLEQRDGISVERAYLLWLEHLIDSERYTRGFPRVAVSYEQLLADWQALLELVSSRLSVELNLDGIAADKINAFLEPALRHHRHGLCEPSPENSLYPLALQAFTLATSGDLNTSDAQFSEIKQQVDTKVHCIAPWGTEICTLKKQRATLKAHATQLEEVNAALTAEIARVKSSASWQLTKPLRFLAHLWRKLVRFGRPA